MAETGRRAPLASPSRSEAEASSDVQSTETQMRRALGLNPGGPTHTPQQRPEQARARHRFVQDGGVPVVMLNHKPEPEVAALRERVMGLEATLETERAALAAAKRSLTDQQAAAQALQTRLAHTELAHAEAIESERRQRLAAQQALADAVAGAAANTIVTTARGPGRPRLPRPMIPADMAPDAAPASASAPGLTPMPKPAGPPVVKAKRGRPRINPLPEPKPLRWWTPSFKAKTKA